MKKEDSKNEDKSPASDINLVESAYGDEPDEWVGFMPEGLEDEDSELSEDDDKNKDDKEDAESVTVLLQEQYPLPEETIVFVTLPAIKLQLGVDVAPMSREDRQGSGQDNGEAVEALMEEYFEGQLNVRDDFMMGPNYVSSEVEAIMTQQQGNVLEFTINGDAQYLGLPTPSEEDVKNTLTQYFGLPTFWEKTDLETYLKESGITGAQVDVMYVDNYPVAGDAGASIYPNDSSSDSGTTTNNQDNLTESDSSNANIGNIESDKKPVGLILGFILFFLCLFAAIGMLLTTYKKEECEACWAGCKNKSKKAAAMSPLAERRRKNRRGWRDFDEEGSNTVAAADRNVSEYGDSATAKSGSHKQSKLQTPQVMQWLSTKWQDLSMSFCKEESDEPSKVLQNIQVVVDNDHMLKQQQQTLQRGEDGGPVFRNFSTADASRYQYSAKTEPRSNVYGGVALKAGQEDTSPQKTLDTYASDDDDALSVEDPILTYTSSSRGAAASPTPYRTSGETAALSSHPWKQDGDTKTTPSAGDAAEEGTLTTSLTEWTNYLNPCLSVPSLPLFHYESERLDDLVASIPRNKSLADGGDEEDDDDDSYTDTEGGTTNTRTRTPSPPHRSSRGGTKSNSRIGRSSSSNHVRSSSGSNYHTSRGNLRRSASSNQVGQSSNNRSQHRRSGSANNSSSYHRRSSSGRRFQPPQQRQQKPQQRDHYKQPKESRYHHSNREI